MKAAKVVLIVLFCAVLINWIRGGQDFHLVQVLPFLGGHKPGIYDAAGLVMLLVLLPWGLRRLRRRGEEPEVAEDPWFADDDDDDSSDAEDEANTEDEE